MNAPLPKYIQPRRFCEEKIMLTGRLPVSGFERLKDLMADEVGEVDIDLLFDKDDERLACITGHLTVHWHLTCQRCLGIIDETVELPIALSPVFNEAMAKRLPERYEPLLLEEDKILLTDIIEDELLLGLPVIAKHQMECSEMLQKFNENN